MAAEYSWLFSPCLVLAGKRAAGLLRLRSSKRVVERKTELLYLTEYEKKANQYAMSVHKLITLGNGACIEASIFTNPRRLF